MKTNNFYEEISIPQAKATFPNGTFRKDDFFIIEGLTFKEFPKHCKEVKCITIILCEEGKLRYEIDGHTVIAEKNDIIIYSLGQRVKNYKILSPTFCCKAILINADCLPMLKESINNKLMLEKKLLDTDTIKLEVDEMESTCWYFTEIKKFTSRSRQNSYFQPAIKLIEVIIQMVLEKVEDIKEKELTNDLRLCNKFIEKVDEIVLLHKPVSFYASQLDISNSTLEKIVRKHIGSTPLAYIHKRLINRICIMAEATTKQSLTIKEIAERTHFKSVSALSRFVRSHISMTLSAYRKKSPAEQLRIIHHTNLDQIAVLKVLPKSDKLEYSIPLPS